CALSTTGMWIRLPAGCGTVARTILPSNQAITNPSYGGGLLMVAMPEPDAAVLRCRDRIIAALSAIVPGEGVIASEREMRPYESDGLTAYRALPMVVVLPETTDQVSRILGYCHREGIKVVPRGAGTSLSGGALPLTDRVMR